LNLYTSNLHFQFQGVCLFWRDMRAPAHPLTHSWSAIAHIF